MRFHDRTILITGGNSGIGLATARLFVEEGARVAITGRNSETLNAALVELGHNARGYLIDILSPEDRKRLVSLVAQDLGKLDILFVNAGVSGKTPTGGTPEGIFEKIVNTNLVSAFWMVNAAAQLLNDGGSVIFSGSIHNYSGQVGMAAYAASKGGLVSMARSIASDLAPRRIRVNVVAPGPIDTPIWQRGANADVDAALLAKQVSAAVPLERWGQPQEVAEAVAFSGLRCRFLHQRY